MNNQEPKNISEAIIVSKAELPISCPMRGKPLWNAHPRIYLPLKEPGEAVCPYCSTKYVYKEE